MLVGKLEVLLLDTVTVQVPVTPLLVAAVIVVVPSAFAVTFPE